MSTSAWEDCESTSAYSTAILDQMLGTRRTQSSRQGAYSAEWQRREASRQMQNATASASAPVRYEGAKQQTATKGRSMVDEFKSYVREYKDWIFTIAIIAVIDHFFLDGALKEKLSTALGKKLDAGDVKGA